MEALITYVSKTSPKTCLMPLPRPGYIFHYNSRHEMNEEGEDVCPPSPGTYVQCFCSTPQCICKAGEK